TWRSGSMVCRSPTGLTRVIRIPTRAMACGSNPARSCCRATIPPRTTPSGICAFALTINLIRGAAYGGNHLPDDVFEPIARLVINEPFELREIRHAAAYVLKVRIVRLGVAL